MKAGTQMLEEKVADKDHPLHETRCDKKAADKSDTVKQIDVVQKLKSC